MCTLTEKLSHDTAEQTPKNVYLRRCRAHATTVPPMTTPITTPMNKGILDCDTDSPSVVGGRTLMLIDFDVGMGISSVPPLGSASERVCPLDG
jgi:hypothetical protein